MNDLLRHPLAGYASALIAVLCGIIWNTQIATPGATQQEMLIKLTRVETKVSGIEQKLVTMGDRYTGEDAKRDNDEAMRMFKMIFGRLDRIDQELDLRAGWMTEKDQENN